MRFLLALLLAAWSSAALASEWKDDPKVETVFAAHGIIGTFALYDAEKGSFTGHNKARAEARFIPASTYKIPNTLIAIAVGAVNGVDDFFPPDGKPQPVKAWEKGMSLREAIRISCVPVYQELARRVGLERMRAELAKLDYGNNEIGTKVDLFWLEGPLAISPVEQARFLARLARGTLPLPEKAQAQTREIVFVKSGRDWSLFAKTGTATRHSPNIGWWVGWVEKEGKIHSFALNIELSQGQSATDSIGIGVQCLTVLGIID